MIKVPVVCDYEKTSIKCRNCDRSVRSKDSMLCGWHWLSFDVTKDNTDERPWEFLEQLNVVKPVCFVAIQCFYDLKLSEERISEIIVRSPKSIFKYRKLGIIYLIDFCIKKYGQDSFVNFRNKGWVYQTPPSVLTNGRTMLHGGQGSRARNNAKRQYDSPQYKQCRFCNQYFQTLWKKDCFCNKMCLEKGRGLEAKSDREQNG